MQQLFAPDRATLCRPFRHQFVMTMSDLPAFLPPPLLPPRPRTRRAFSTHRIPTTSTRSPQTLKVGIAGAGIAGLSTAIALLKTPNTPVTSVTLYDPRTTTDEIQGAAINLNSAAAILMGNYNLPLEKYANPIISVTSRTTQNTPLFQVNVPQLVQANPEAQKFLTVHNRPTFLTIMRDDLQSALLAALPPGATLLRGPSARVLGVDSDGPKPCFKLPGNALSEAYDLVIGADGLRSTVRATVAGNETPPIYTGFRVQWAICPPGTSTLQPGSLEQWFGDGGYTLRYAAGKFPNQREMLAFSFRDSSAAKENVDYGGEARVREHCQRRLLQCGMPDEVMACFERATRFIETGVYQHARLKSWSTGGNCVLVGDSGTFHITIR